MSEFRAPDPDEIAAAGPGELTYSYDPRPANLHPALEDGVAPGWLVLREEGKPARKIRVTMASLDGEGFGVTEGEWQDMSTTGDTP